MYLLIKVLDVYTMDKFRNMFDLIKKKSLFLCRLKNDIF